MVITIGLAIALVLGVVGIVEAKGRDWAAWGVVVMAAVLLYSRL